TTQRKVDCVVRLALSTCPQRHVRDVLRASTVSTLMPRLLATCLILANIDANGHPCMINRCFLAHLIRVRMPLRSSTAIVPAVDFKASPTIPMATFQSNQSTDLRSDQSLLFGAFDPCADAFEVFNGNRPGGRFQGFTNNPDGHVPEQPINRSPI